MTGPEQPLPRRLRHVWRVEVRCERCGLHPDEAGEWCEGLEVTEDE